MSEAEAGEKSASEAMIALRTLPTGLTGSIKSLVRLKSIFGKISDLVPTGEVTDKRGVAYRPSKK